MNASNLPLLLVGLVFAFIGWAALIPSSSLPKGLPSSPPSALRSALASSQPVLLEFSASWCGPCRTVAPLVRELERELHGRARVMPIDVDQNHELAQQYGVRSIPCFIAVKNRREIARKVGVISKVEMKRMLGL